MSATPFGATVDTPRKTQGDIDVRHPSQEVSNVSVRPLGRRNGRSERPVLGSLQGRICLPTHPASTARKPSRVVRISPTDRSTALTPSLVRRIKIRQTECVTSSRCQTPASALKSKLTKSSITLDHREGPSPTGWPVRELNPAGEPNRITHPGSTRWPSPRDRRSRARPWGSPRDRRCHT